MIDNKSIPTAPDLGLEEYEILGELGRGGASVVYLARDRVLGRNVAIKVSRDAFLDDQESVARFEREARMLASLQHTNIVTLYAAKRLPAGSLALVMQHGNWRTLKAALREGTPFSSEQIEGVLRDIASALVYLHQRGVVHRDIKPENIFVDRDTGHALLSDFGIAKYGDGRASVTLTGVVIGTPVYMSPEQIDGAELDGRSDLYSLGMVGYEMVAGRRPWDGESLYSVIFKQKNERLPSLKLIRADVSHALCEVIEGAIEKKPEDRWSDADVFLAKLSDEQPDPVAALTTPVLPRAVAAVPAPMLPEPGHESVRRPQEPAMIQVHRIVAEAEASMEEAASIRWTRQLTLVAAMVVLLAGGAGAIALASDWDPQLSSRSALEPEEVIVQEVSTPAAQFASPSFEIAASDSAASLEMPAAGEQLPATVPIAAAVPPSTAAARRRASAQGGAESSQEEAGETETQITPVGMPIPVGLPIPSLEVVAGKAEEVRPSGGQVVLSYSKLPASATVAAPELVNRPYIGHVMNEMYPKDLRDQGIGGTVMLSLLVTETGSVISTTIATSSGHTLLDSTAVRIGRRMRFSPAENRSAPRRVWISMPLTFEGRP